MKKIIIEIDDKQYEDAINDTEWDTLSLGIYLKEQVKNGKPLEAEIEKIKSEFLFECKENLRFDNDIVLECFTDLVDKKISELKGENNG